MTRANTRMKPSANELLRLLRFIERSGTCAMEAPAESGRAWLRSGARSLAISRNTLRSAFNAVLIRGNESGLELTPEGSSRLKRLLHPEMEFIAQHGQLRESTCYNAGADVPVLVNDAESPLRRLYQRRDRNGKSWLSDSQYEAGERLRRDFERAQLQPGVSTNWQSLPTGSVSSGFQGNNDICDFAIDCRKRVADAVDALDRELADVALDICCFLKGFEQVERERQWPPRSAKLMLRTALSCLARHYGLSIQARNHDAEIVRWGDGSERPSLR